MTPTAWSVRIAAELRAVGLTLRPEQIETEWRGDRIVTALPDDRIAWFATTPAAADRLQVEDKVLRLIAERCSVRIPTVLSASGPFSLRTTVPGAVDPNALANRLRAHPALVSAAAATLARILAEQHTRIDRKDVDAWLPTAPAWPPPRAVVEGGLPLVVRDTTLRRRIANLLDAYNGGDARERDRALVHSDLGLHNVAFDPATGLLNGVFDYGDAAWADRHLDFRYLVFAAVPDALLDATMAAYHDATGIALDRDRVLLCNAAAAIGHLADRAGHGSEDVLGGRTLAGDLRWTEWALGRAGF